MPTRRPARKPPAKKPTTVPTPAPVASFDTASATIQDVVPQESSEQPTSELPLEVDFEQAYADNTPDKMFNPLTATREQLVAALRAQGEDGLADAIEANAAAQAAIEAALDIEDVVVGNPEPYWHQYSHEEVLSLVCGALMGKAEQWDAEAAAEMQKGAANTTMVGTLRWGANQLREFANIVIHLPEGEMVDPPPPPAVEEAAE